jgi:hypothetical protein
LPSVAFAPPTPFLPFPRPFWSRALSQLSLQRISSSSVALPAVFQGIRVALCAAHRRRTGCQAAVGRLLLTHCFSVSCARHLLDWILCHFAPAVIGQLDLGPWRLCTPRALNSHPAPCAIRPQVLHFTQLPIPANRMVFWLRGPLRHTLVHWSREARSVG